MNSLIVIVIFFLYSNIIFRYRILPPAGTQLAEGLVQVRHCGSDRTSYLNGKHPKIDGETVQRTVCGNWKDGICSSSKKIEITNCGDFFVYKFPDLSACSNRYCTQ